ncbi:MAG: DMT family transporter [Bacteroidales bacterium]|nr:DMT family transporter [Bacteroidales bacterium]
MKKILTWGGNLPGEALLLTTSIVWGPLFYSGIVAFGIGFTLQVFGQSKVDPALASLILSLEAVFAILGGMILLGERLSGSEWLGCVVMLAAVILVQLKGQQQKH